MTENTNPPPSKDYVGSIVIPAYNEGKNILPLLEALTSDGTSEKLEIAVICNGCKDDTFELASRFSDYVRVENLTEASKIAALNKGDSVTTAFPRIYLDADIVLTGADLITFVNEFKNSELLVGGVKIRFDVTDRPWMVRCFYKIWHKLPYMSANNKSVGSGFYALSEEGRARFEEFPKVIADDLFVDSRFDFDEKFRSPTTGITVQTPFNVASLVKIKSRSYAGNVELGNKGFLKDKPPSGTKEELLKLIFNVKTCIPALVYMGIQISSRLHTRLFRKTEKGVWLRDETVRTPR